MPLITTRRGILGIAFPIMLGSAAQQIIGLSDSIFLYHYSEIAFASIALMSVFYLIVASTGYGFSKGGQIIIARRLGEGDIKSVSKSFYSLLFFELALASFMFLFLRFGTEWFLKFFISSDRIYEHSLMYIQIRAYGVFFSYAGIAIIALYTGLAKTRFIIIDSIILVVSNVILNYILIFGKFGFPEMGIRGAAIACNIAEAIGLSVYIIYIFASGGLKKWGLGKIYLPDKKLLISILKLSSPIVGQAVVSIGSWFLFFALIENYLGERSLAISNLVRNVLLILTIPSWGFSSAINTMVSQLMGMRKRMGVLPIIFKTANLNLIITMVITIPVVLFPTVMLYPLFGGEDMSLILESKNVLYVLGVSMVLGSLGMIYFNGLSGTGAAAYGMKIQIIVFFIYILYMFLVLEFGRGSLVLAWTSELVYWILINLLSIRYLYSKNWYNKKV
jgi:putative MATE family efflux protein